MAQLKELKEARRRKLDDLRNRGVDPYPARVGEFFDIFSATHDFEKLEKEKTPISLVGRIRLLRPQGGIIFGQVEDLSGRVQFFLNKKELAPALFDVFKSNLETGDFVRLTGVFFTTKSGEKTLNISDFQVLTKALRPLPEKRLGLQDIEKRLRRRYLDLLFNPETKELFRKKAVFWDSVRSFLKQRDFLEVEAPAFEAIPGGAEAEPFKTHYNALDQDLYLRISLELPLKKLLVGGFERVFEVGKVFRNEGMDAEHLQDYTAMEFYWAYRDLEDLKKILREMYLFVIEKTLGGLTHEYKGNKIDWSGQWPEVDYFEFFKENTGLDLNGCSDDDLREKIKELKLKTDLKVEKIGRGRMIDLIYKKTCRPKLIQPCFLVGHPLEISPLAKKDPANPKKVLRLQILAGSSELGNGFTELNDPLDQKERFEQQMKLREAGDKEAQIMDDDFVEALEYGMPPAAGFGLSERLFSFLMDKSIRETTIFPAVRTKEVKSEE